jgi:serine/threonine protein kinase
MPSRVERLRVGPYRLTRHLASGRLADRWIAFHDAEHSLHVAHRFKTDAPLIVTLRDAVAEITRVAHPHLLPVEGLYEGVAGSAWIITPFTGNHDGLVTLNSLLAEKGGRMTPSEAERALCQLLEGIAAAHEAGCHHGPLKADEVLVDRRGSLAIELYGLGRRLGKLRQRPASEVSRDEVRSVVGIGYTLITGLSAEEPRIPATRLFPRLDRRWDDWINEGLDPLGGYASAEEAMALLPGLRREVEERQASPVQTVIRRFRQAIRAE